MPPRCWSARGRRKTSHSSRRRRPHGRRHAEGLARERPRAGRSRSSPIPRRELKKLKDVRFVGTVEQIPAGKIRACVVALKPQILRTEGRAAAEVSPERGAPMISIAAGTSIATLRKAWGRRAHILRAMPNTPGAIGARHHGDLFAAPERDRRRQETRRTSAGVAGPDDLGQTRKADRRHDRRVRFRARLCVSDGRGAGRRGRGRRHAARRRRRNSHAPPSPARAPCWTSTRARRRNCAAT